MRPVYAAAIAIQTLLATSCAVAESEDTLTLNAVTELPGGDVTEKVIGGTPVNKSEWPATFYTVPGVGQQNRECTAQLVGPQAVLLAAHCLCTTPRAAPPCNPRSKIALRRKVDVITGNCTVQAGYQGGCASSDLALCKLATAVTVAGPYETVNLELKRAAPATKALLLGYGCIAPNDGNDSSNPGANPQLFAAETTLGGAPSLNNSDDPDYIEIIDTVGICPGDSGGAVYAGTGGVDMIAAQRRSVVAINSCARHNTPVNGKHQSLLVNTSTKKSAEFIRNWADANRTEVCGVTQSEQFCRQP